MSPDVARLAAGKYLLVTTFRKDGTPKPTPVWVVVDGERLAVWTATDTYKVKRIRNNPKVRVAPCDPRGNPTGDEVAATAEVLDQPASDRIRRLIKRRYGMLGWLVVTGSRLRRGTEGSVGVAITVGAPEPGEPA